MFELKYTCIQVIRETCNNVDHKLGERSPYAHVKRLVLPKFLFFSEKNYITVLFSVAKNFSLHKFLYKKVLHDNYIILMRFKVDRERSNNLLRLQCIVFSAISEAHPTRSLYREIFIRTSFFALFY